MADRGPVKVRHGRIDDLIAIYKQSYVRMAEEIIAATEAGKVRRFQVMVLIRKELGRLGVDVDKWVKSEIPQYYLDGANQATQDLRKLGIDPGKAPAVVNREAIKALTDDVALSFAEGMRGIARNAQSVLDDALRQQLNFIVADGKLTGESRRVISANIRTRLKDEGFSSLVDRRGRSWTFDRYAQMLARTKAVEARNQGLANTMLSAGYDLVQVSNHQSSHKECRVWEGRVLSLTGKTPGYPTLFEASDAGLFHPNCEHAVNVIEPELAKETYAFNISTQQYEPSLSLVT